MMLSGAFLHLSRSDCTLVAVDRVVGRAVVVVVV